MGWLGYTAPDIGHEFLQAYLASATAVIVLPGDLVPVRNLRAGYTGALSTAEWYECQTSVRFSPTLRTSMPQQRTLPHWMQAS